MTASNLVCVHRGVSFACSTCVLQQCVSGQSDAMRRRHLLHTYIIILPYVLNQLSITVVVLRGLTQ